MPGPRVLPRLVALFAASVSGALSAAIAADAWRVSKSSDADLLVMYRGQAVEDILGFGWWPTWLLVALVQAMLHAIVFRYLSPSSKRFVIPLLLVVFAIASLLDYSSFQRQHSLMFRAS